MRVKVLDTCYATPGLIMTLTCVSIFCWCGTTGGGEKQLYSGWLLRALATMEQFGRVFGCDSLCPGHCTVKAVQFELLVN